MDADPQTVNPQLERAVADALADAGIEMTPAEISASARRAQDLAAGTTPEDMENLRKFMMQFGLPAAQTMFRSAVAKSSLHGDAKGSVLRRIAAFGDCDQPGCFTVDYHNSDGTPGERAYLLLDKCGPKHNLTRQLNRLRERIGMPAMPDPAASAPAPADPAPAPAPVPSAAAVERWTMIQRQLSLLIHHGRHVYGQLAHDNKSLLVEIAGSEAAAAELSMLLVDPANTTLYLKPDWPVRIGLFVRFQSDVDAEIARIEARDK